jgi:hypothetical protein
MALDHRCEQSSARGSVFRQNFVVTENVDSLVADRTIHIISVEFDTTQRALLSAAVQFRWCGTGHIHGGSEGRSFVGRRYRHRLEGLWGLPSRATSIALAAVEEGNAWNLELP